MMKGTLTSTGFVAVGCAIALVVPAVQAQTLDMQTSMYERLLEANQAGRHSRMLRECGPNKDLQLIADAQLRASCFAKFLAAEDQPSLGSQEGLTGSSTGMMNSTGTGPNDPDMYGTGAGR
jgi:hypothetical protein